MVKNTKLRFNEFAAEIFKELKFDTDPGCINYSNFSKGIMSAAKQSVTCELNKFPRLVYTVKRYSSSFNGKKIKSTKSDSTE